MPRPFCSRPDSVGFWVWWRRGDQSPILVETTGDTDGLLIRECGNGKPRPMADWELQRGHGQFYTRVYRRMYPRLKPLYDALAARTIGS